MDSNQKLYDLEIIHDKLTLNYQFSILISSNLIIEKYHLIKQVNKILLTYWFFYMLKHSFHGWSIFSLYFY
jgi:hypothetical protein